MHLEALEKRLQDLEIAGKNDPSASSIFQNDKRVFQQVKKDLNVGKEISIEYASLAKSEGVQSELRALAFYSSGKKSFEELKALHLIKIKELQNIIEKANAGSATLKSMENSKNTVSLDFKKTDSNNLKDQNKNFIVKKSKDFENVKSLSPDQLKELDKKLNKISNKSLRDQLRARLLQQLRENPSNSAEQ